ncbi:MAG: amidophosphoribosyltransferase [Deltaproteobacteria bacterium]|nr:amidophosphoribosyltransferase [Deltaproteobacteria bacterium]
MCGVFGIFGHPEAANLTYLGLHALQHRGQESAGIVATSDGEQFSRHLGRGLVADVFDETILQERLGGHRAIGHVRYSTAGGSHAQAAQPFAVTTARGPLAIAHNGNLVNADSLRADLERDGAIFSTQSDTEVVVHLMARARAPRLEDRIREVAAQLEGAYTLLFMDQTGIIGVRDPEGFRPLILGKVGDAWVLASETCALDLVEGKLIREIEPGEMIHITQDGLRTERLYHLPDARRRACIFELVYFARPDSRIFEQSVYEARVKMGQRLAEEAPVDADLVIPVPDSGVPAALGYAEASGLPFRHGLIRSHYVGRTFIEPKQSIRAFGVRLKLSAVRSVLEGKRVVVVDDSVVRGTTSRKIVGILRNAGAKEVHLRVSSPPTRFPCFYGVDTPNRAELIAATHSVADVARYVTADTLAYLSEEGLHTAVGDPLGEGRRYCNACFTGEYSAGRSLIQSRLPVVRE